MSPRIVSVIWCEFIYLIDACVHLVRPPRNLEDDNSDGDEHAHKADEHTESDQDMDKFDLHGWGNA